MFKTRKLVKGLMDCGFFKRIAVVTDEKEIHTVKTKDLYKLPYRSEEWRVIDSFDTKEEAEAMAYSKRVMPHIPFDD
jgi:hypothetical protein